ncbi:MAG: 2Fe-2S iron-sulfur cluster binding domain-containing protein [Deltaproteobacteria bacterium]|nr:2Fe-2S iron-sulfur cluster binding domain-containing protein [Deltaproteobacteria bacterium]
MKVRFRFPNGEEVDVAGYEALNLLAHGQIAERSLQSRCGGHCECGTCRVIVESGAVSAMRPEEKALLARLGVTDSRVRLACQTFPADSKLNVVGVPAEKFIDARGKKSG